MRTDRLFLLFLPFYLLTTSCSVNKYLAEDELLYKESKIEFINPKKITKKKKLATDLRSIARPVPNTGLFKFRLFLYFWMGESKNEKGIKHWIKTKLGEPPALYTGEQVERNRLQMRKFMRDNGYFGTEIEQDTARENKTVTVTYKVASRGQYHLENVYLPNDSTAIGQLVKRHRDKSYLRSGEPYLKFNLDSERARLTSIATNNGYLDFNPDHFYYFVDTIRGSLKTDLYLAYEPPQDTSSRGIYRMARTFVYPNFDLSSEETSQYTDTIVAAPDLYIIQNYEILRPGVLNRLILQEEGDVYNKRLQDASINHLLDLGIFKFVNLKYNRKRINGQSFLDRYLYLTPDLPESTSAEFEINNRTGNFLGTAARVAYNHGNIFRGGEQFRVELSGGVENQVGNRQELVNTAEANLELSLSMPRFVVPFLKNPPAGFYVPRTRLSLGTHFEWRTGFFQVNSQNLKLGYDWRETQTKRHIVNPINLQRVEVTRITPEFDSLLQVNPRLRSSFENVFIAGLEYSYIFTDQKPNAQNYWFFRTDIDLVGNLLYAVNTAFRQGGQQPYRFISLPFSQFFKVGMDARYYYNFRNSTLVSRVAPGVAVPYGNSEIIPYIEQFFIGGANSLRAFPLRGLGPGSFVKAVDPQNAVERQFLDQTGDIKLEMNLEYRFNIFSYLKGATFIDAGNVWLISSEESEVGLFSLNNFWKEIAVGTGLGARLDFEFFVIRLDAAFPLRQPVAGKGMQWTIGDIKFGDKDWRKENLVWNLAIGYPF